MRKSNSIGLSLARALQFIYYYSIWTASGFCYADNQRNQALFPEESPRSSRLLSTSFCLHIPLESSIL